MGNEISIVVINLKIPQENIILDMNSRIIQEHSTTLEWLMTLHISLSN